MADKKATNETKEVKNATQTITPKTIYIIIGVVLAVILIVIYIYRVNQVRKEEQITNSYLLTTDTVSLEIKNLDEVSQILAGAPQSGYFVLITYTGDAETYALEESIKGIIDDYKLNDVFYYLNVLDIMEQDNYITRINNAFNTDEIDKIPTILYYQDGELVYVVERDDDNMINSGDLQKLLDIYEYEGQ